MKGSLIILLLACCVGCSRSGLFQSEPVVHEYFVDVMIEADSAANLYVDEQGQYEALCRLGRSVAEGSKVRRPVLESRPVSPPGRRFGSADGYFCQFEKTLPFEFCAMTSVQSEMGCKVSLGSGPGWFVEVEFSEPESAYLHCTIACIDLVRN